MTHGRQRPTGRPGAKEMQYLRQLYGGTNYDDARGDLSAGVPDGRTHRYHVEGDRRGTRNGWHTRDSLSPVDREAHRQWMAAAWTLAMCHARRIAHVTPRGAAVRAWRNAVLLALTITPPGAPRR